MGASRLSLALDGAGPDLQAAGRIAVFAPRAGADLTPLPRERVHVIVRLKPDHDHFAEQGYACAVAPEGRYGAALVCLPRARPLARALVAAAAAVSDGPVLVDGAKTDGVESMLRDCRRRRQVAPPVSKAHGKLFWFGGGPGFADWAAREQVVAGGFVTVPGVFSADGPDPGSVLLAERLPERLGARVADFGGGWGYLGARALSRPDIEVLDLVEADHAALACARRNIDDPRLRLHWADVRRWRPETRLDAVITNPPFHSGRAAAPELGGQFIAAAAACLAPAGRLWLVANRHLPYESVLSRHFAEVDEAGGDGRFKLIRAARPARAGR